MILEVFWRGLIGGILFLGVEREGCGKGRPLKSFLETYLHV
jgi:hypothetical protein